MAEYGFVYCLSNRGMAGVYKIGFTRNSPHLRAQQLSAPTGVPAEFEVEWYAECEEADVLEKELHDRFSFDRVSSSREFFRGCPIEMFNALDYRQVSYWLSPDHLFRIEREKKKLAVVV